MKYQHVVVTAQGGPEVLALHQEASVPEPGPGEVRLKVLAAGTGFTDTAIRRGTYPGLKVSYPFTLGYDIVAEVDRLGPDVEGMWRGQRVLDLPVTGGYSQYLIRPAQTLVPMLEDLDPALAVCLPLSYVTAYQMLNRMVRLQAADEVVIQGASGAVGTALLDLGRLMGLHMYATSSPHKFDLLRSYGAQPFNYHDPACWTQIRQASRQRGGQGIAVVFDAIGGHRQWMQAMQCLRSDGCLVAYGAQKIARNEDSLATVLWGFAKLYLWWSWGLFERRRAVFYHIAQRRQKYPAEYAADLRVLLELLGKGDIQPLVAERRPLADAQAVHAAIDAGQVSGKIVLLPWTDEV